MYKLKKVREFDLCFNFIYCLNGSFFFFSTGHAMEISYSSWWLYALNILFVSEVKKIVKKKFLLIKLDARNKSDSPWLSLQSNKKLCSNRKMKSQNYLILLLVATWNMYTSDRSWLEYLLWVKIRKVKAILLGTRKKNWDSRSLLSTLQNPGYLPIRCFQTMPHPSSARQIGIRTVGLSQQLV